MACLQDHAPLPQLLTLSSDGQRPRWTDATHSLTGIQRGWSWLGRLPAAWLLLLVMLGYLRCDAAWFFDLSLDALSFPIPVALWIRQLPLELFTGLGTSWKLNRLG
ncbi:hypothetical protein BDW69DRAFT_168013 [Aspergillus filifer]